MTALLPALRSSSILSPFLGDFLAEFTEWEPRVWPDQFGGFRMDITEHPDRYVLEADLPGIAPDEVDVTLDNRRLTIAVKPRAEVRDSGDESGQYVIRERRLHARSRTVLLPQATSEKDIDASMKDGVLTVTIKKDESLMPKKITVQ